VKAESRVGIEVCVGVRSKYRPVVDVTQVGYTNKTQKVLNLVEVYFCFFRLRWVPRFDVRMS
jgi:hypothetical protein